jgi:hypothetical protein
MKEEEMKFLKDRLNFLIVLMFVCVVVFVGILYLAVEYDKRIIAVKFEDVQLERLKELSKQDFRDVEHTMLMLADQYIEYHNREKK